MNLSEDATRYAVCAWKFMPQMTIRATYPDKLSAEMQARLNELTSAGLLAREDDPRGPAEWKPTDAMRKFTSERPIPADML